MKVEFLKILVAFSGAIWLGALGLFAPISKSRTGFLRLQRRDLAEAFFVRWWRQQDEKTKNLVKELVKAGRCPCQKPTVVDDFRLFSNIAMVK